MYLWDGGLEGLIYPACLLTLVYAEKTQRKFVNHLIFVTPFLNSVKILTLQKTIAVEKSLKLEKS